jgi:kinesin family member 18/19
MQEAQLQGSYGVSSNVFVAVRIRDLLRKEKEVCKTKTLFPDSPNSVNLRSQQELIATGALVESASRGSVTSSRSFLYDTVLSEFSSQTDVFEAAALPVIDSVLDGINATVFAYGATSAGKTHTMLGTSREPGVMVLTLMELFARIGSFESTNVRCSFVEIYNEVVRDLLSHYGHYQSPPSLDIREDPSTGQTFINGATEIDGISDIDDLMEILNSGNARRTTEPTAANETSSRSHAILQVFIEQRQPGGRVLSSKLSLVDLAGSERARDTKNRGIRFVEGGNINRSLLALGNCIQALSAGRVDYIPYRDSKLTRLLKDSLGGNCRTVLIANVSPYVGHYRDTLNTLKFALKAKNVEMEIAQNIFLEKSENEIENYKKIISQLENMVKHLQDQLKRAKSKDSAEIFNIYSDDEADDPVATAPWELKNKLMNTISEQLELRSQLANVESRLEAQPDNSHLSDQRMIILTRLTDISAVADSIHLTSPALPNQSTEYTINECIDIIDRMTPSTSGRKPSPSLQRTKSTTSLRNHNSTPPNALEDKLVRLKNSLLQLEQVKIERPDIPLLSTEVGTTHLVNSMSASSLPGRRTADIFPSGLIKFN